MREETDLIECPERNLTQLQRSFAETFVRYRGLNRAYIESGYDCAGLDARTIDKRARALMKNPYMRAYIENMIDVAAGEAIFTVREALARFLAIAAANPNELVSVRVNCCRHCHGQGFGRQWRPSEYFNAMDDAEKNGRELPKPQGGLGFNATLAPHPDCPECDGEGEPSVVVHDTDNLSPGAQLLYGGAKVNAKGQVEIIVADRHKALETAAKIIGALGPDSVALTVNNVASMANVVNLSTIDPSEARRAYMDMIAVDGGVKPAYVYAPPDAEGKPE